MPDPFLNLFAHPKAAQDITIVNVIPIIKWYVNIASSLYEMIQSYTERSY